MLGPAEGPCWGDLWGVCWGLVSGRRKGLGTGAIPCADTGHPVRERAGFDRPAARPTAIRTAESDQTGPPSVTPHTVKVTGGDEGG